MQPNKTKNEKRAILWTIDDNPFATNAIHSFPLQTNRGWWNCKTHTQIKPEPHEKVGL